MWIVKFSDGFEIEVKHKDAKDKTEAIWWARGQHKATIIDVIKREKPKCDIPGCPRLAPMNDIFCKKHR